MSLTKFHSDDGEFDAYNMHLQLEDSQSHIANLLEMLALENYAEESAQVSNIISGMENMLGKFSDNHYDVQNEMSEMLESSRRGLLTHSQLAELVTAEATRSQHLVGILNSLKSQIENMYDALTDFKLDPDVDEVAQKEVANTSSQLASKVELMMKSVTSMDRIAASPAKRLTTAIATIDSEVVMHVNKTKLESKDVNKSPKRLSSIVAQANKGARPPSAAPTPRKTINQGNAGGTNTTGTTGTAAAAEPRVVEMVSIGVGDNSVFEGGKPPSDFRPGKFGSNLRNAYAQTTISGESGLDTPPINRLGAPPNAASMGAPGGGSYSPLSFQSRQSQVAGAHAADKTATDAAATDATAAAAAAAAGAAAGVGAGAGAEHHDTVGAEEDEEHDEHDDAEGEEHAEGHAKHKKGHKKASHKKGGKAHHGNKQHHGGHGGDDDEEHHDAHHGGNGGHAGKVKHMNGSKIQIPHINTGHGSGVGDHPATTHGNRHGSEKKTAGGAAPAAINTAALLAALRSDLEKEMAAEMEVEVKHRVKLALAAAANRDYDTFSTALAAKSPVSRQSFVASFTRQASSLAMAANAQPKAAPSEIAAAAAEHTGTAAAPSAATNATPFASDSATQASDSAAVGTVPSALKKHASGRKNVTIAENEVSGVDGAPAAQSLRSPKAADARDSKAESDSDGAHRVPPAVTTTAASAAARSPMAQTASTSTGQAAVHGASPAAAAASAPPAVAAPSGASASQSVTPTHAVAAAAAAPAVSGPAPVITKVCVNAAGQLVAYPSGEVLTFVDAAGQPVPFPAPVSSAASAEGGGGAFGQGLLQSGQEVPTWSYQSQAGVPLAVGAPLVHPGRVMPTGEAAVAVNYRTAGPGAPPGVGGHHHPAHQMQLQDPAQPGFDSAAVPQGQGAIQVPTFVPGQHPQYQHQQHQPYQHQPFHAVHAGGAAPINVPYAPMHMAPTSYPGAANAGADAAFQQGLQVSIDETHAGVGQTGDSTVPGKGTSPTAIAQHSQSLHLGSQEIGAPSFYTDHQLPSHLQPSGPGSIGPVITVPPPQPSSLSPKQSHHGRQRGGEGHTRHSGEGSAHRSLPMSDDASDVESAEFRRFATMESKAELERRVAAGIPLNKPNRVDMFNQIFESRPDAKKLEMIRIQAPESLAHPKVHKGTCTAQDTSVPTDPNFKQAIVVGESMLATQQQQVASLIDLSGSDIVLPSVVPPGHPASRHASRPPTAPKPIRPLLETEIKTIQDALSKALDADACSYLLAELEHVLKNGKGGTGSGAGGANTGGLQASTASTFGHELPIFDNQGGILLTRTYRNPTPPATFIEILSSSDNPLFYLFQEYSSFLSKMQRVRLLNAAVLEDRIKNDLPQSKSAQLLLGKLLEAIVVTVTECNEMMGLLKECEERVQQIVDHLRRKPDHLPTVLASVQLKELFAALGEVEAIKVVVDLSLTEFRAFIERINAQSIHEVDHLMRESTDFEYCYKHFLACQGKSVEVGQRLQMLRERCVRHNLGSGKDKKKKKKPKIEFDDQTSVGMGAPEGYQQELQELRNEIEELKEQLAEAKEEFEDQEVEMLELLQERDRSPDALLFFAIMHDPSYMQNLQQLVLQVKHLRTFADGTGHMDFITLRKRLQVCCVLTPSLEKLCERYALMYQKWSNFRLNWFSARKLNGGSADAFNSCPLCFQCVSPDGDGTTGSGAGSPKKPATLAVTGMDHRHYRRHQQQQKQLKQNKELREVSRSQNLGAVEDMSTISSPGKERSRSYTSLPNIK